MTDNNKAKSVLKKIFWVSDQYTKAYLILKIFYFALALLMITSHLFITMNQARMESLICDIEIYKGSIASSEECTIEFTSSHMPYSQETWDWLSTWSFIPLISASLILISAEFLLNWHLGGFWFDNKRGGRRKKSKGGGDDNGDGFINSGGGGGGRKREMEVVAN